MAGPDVTPGLDSSPQGELCSSPRSIGETPKSEDSEHQEEDHDEEAEEALSPEGADGEIHMLSGAELEDDAKCKNTKMGPSQQCEKPSQHQMSPKLVDSSRDEAIKEGGELDVRVEQVVRHSQPHQGEGEPDADLKDGDVEEAEEEVLEEEDQEVEVQVLDRAVQLSQQPVNDSGSGANGEPDGAAPAPNKASGLEPKCDERVKSKATDDVSKDPSQEQSDEPSAKKSKQGHDVQPPIATPLRCEGSVRKDDQQVASAPRKLKQENSYPEEDARMPLKKVCVDADKGAVRRSSQRLQSRREQATISSFSSWYVNMV